MDEFSDGSIQPAEIIYPLIAELNIVIGGFKGEL